MHRIFTVVVKINCCCVHVYAELILKPYTASVGVLSLVFLARYYNVKWVLHRLCTCQNFKIAVCIIRSEL